MTKLHLDIDEKLNIDAQDLIGLSAAVLGITGSGKSNTSAVLVEELLTNGFPMTIIDIEGEYWGLKERFEVLVVGRGEHADFEVDAEHAGKLAELSITRGITVVLDMNDFDEDEMFDFLLPYFMTLWKAAGTLKRPYQVIIEEAHEFVPQGARTPLKQVLTRIALRGRKRGLAAVLISQRSSKVDKDLLTQAQLVFLHRVIHPIDVKVYEEIVPLPPREVDEHVGKLVRGQAIVLFRNEPIVSQIRVRSTFHAGVTPTFENAAEPELRKLDMALLTDLRKALDSPEPTVDQSGRIRELEQALARLQAEHNKTCAQLEEMQAKTRFFDEHPERIPAAPVATDLPAGSVQGDLSSEQMKRRTSEQRKRFDYLVKDVMGLRRWQRSILRFLTEREGTPFSQRDLAKRLDLSIRTVGETLDLEQLELIVKTGKGTNARYVSKVTSYIQTKFPQLDPADLKDELLHGLMKKEVNNR